MCSERPQSLHLTCNVVFNNVSETGPGISLSAILKFEMQFCSSEHPVLARGLSLPLPLFVEVGFVLSLFVGGMVVGFCCFKHELFMCRSL